MGRERKSQAVGRQEKTSPALYAWTAALSAIIGFGAVYLTVGRPDNVERAGVARIALPERPSRPAVVEPASTPAPAAGDKLNSGQVAAFVFKKEREAVPAITFTDAEGKPRTLADWKGRIVLLNLWATWCAPCRHEMPALDRLQKELGSDKFEVVALSVDRTGIEGARKFFGQVKIEKLALYADATAKMGTVLKAVGLPTTLLIDAEGREIGRLVGPAEWDHEDAKRLIRSALPK